MSKGKNLRWGIVGLGKIAHKFIKDLVLVDNIEITACASKSLDNAKEFAKEYNIANSYGSYAELFADDNIDIVYIGTTHDTHAEISIQALNAGKHVLCEKPLAVNRPDALRIVEAARKNNVFMMEAFWSRFNPSIRAVLEHVENKTLGEINYVNADFGFQREVPNTSRMYNMDLAGGALLDIGVYPIFLAYSIFGKPKEILATGRFHETGADIQSAAILKYDNGLAQIMSGFTYDSDMVAKIYGTEGRIFIDSIWHHTQSYTMVKDDVTSKFSLPTKGRGFTYEIEECIKCISQNKIESGLWSHQNSLDLLEITDEIRKQLGLKYPFE